jgi:hypothetical protein
VADYVNMSMEGLKKVFDSLNPLGWRQAKDNWHDMARRINEAQDGLNHAWENTPVFHANDADSEAVAFRAFEDNVDLSKGSATEWSTFAANVGTCLDRTAAVIEANKPFFDAAHSDWASAGDDEGKKATALRQARLYVWNVANAVRDTFNGVQVPKQPYQGPLGSSPDDDKAGGGDPRAQAGGAGAGVGGGAGGLGAGDKPADSPAAAPKAPEAKDPLDQAEKFLKVAGSGIDLLGKPAEVADKYVGLAQHLKDLLGGSGTGTEGLDPGSLIPDDLSTDQPTLAGGTSTAPTFDPGTLTGGGSAGGGLPSTGPVAGIGAVGSAAGIGATGSVGAAPSLAGKGSSASAAGAQQQGMSPMYPPMGGMGAGAGAGGGGRGEIKPGTASPRAGGFNLPAEQSESERWRRHGVQADLQGRTNGEHRSAAAAPALRKRKGPARAAAPADQEVLDEELWRL